MSSACNLCFLCAILFLAVCVVLANDSAESKLSIEVLEEGDCAAGKAKDNDFITIHFSSNWDSGDKISSTYDRGVPVEIQLGTKMLSSGLDEGLDSICIGEKRKITVSADIGLEDPVKAATLEPSKRAELAGKKVIYEVQLVSISDRTTVNTFNYLDLDGDKRISAAEAEALVKMFMKALSTDMGIDVQHLVSFFMTLHDKDSDGFISEAEFMESVSVNEKVLQAFGSKDEL